ncbi:multidrug resistance-associated protein 5 [Tanacetum coccineum]|uniref:Multidrug resistance-associated protein 5 n=1 Tax=Tanacetum coccineum TaxID=301880 RepID=A0ABQ5E2Y6_9ASTR
MDTKLSGNLLNKETKSAAKRYAHRNQKVVPSGESRFKVRDGYEGFKVDKRLRTCTCMGWQLTGLPCQHRFASIYFLHKDPKEYVSEWYTKERFVSSYNHYIEGVNVMDQWPITSYQNPKPPIIRRMPGRPPHKRKRDVSENDGNRTRISSASASVNTPTIFARGGKRSCKGGKTPSVSSRGGGKNVSTPASPSVGFEISITSISVGVRVTKSGVRLRGGVYIRGNSPSKAASVTPLNLQCIGISLWGATS